jgi:CDP-diacylglycerol--glycerol-3-phosphate 3-phosphatidyltransferase/cardiolipin synthase
MIPNAISLSRLVLAAAFTRYAAEPAIAVAILCAAGISDWLDGWLAKRWGQESRIGAILDPVCDRLFVVPVLAALVFVHGLPAWKLAVLVTRDVANTLGALVVWARRPDQVSGLRPRRSGKIVTSLQFWSVVHVILALPGFDVTLAAVAVASAWAVADYGAQFRRLLRASKPAGLP